jgi:hypothetical protein
VSKEEIADQASEQMRTNMLIEGSVLALFLARFAERGRSRASLRTASRRQHSITDFRKTATAGPTDSWRDGSSNGRLARQAARRGHRRPLSNGRFGITFETLSDLWK